MSESREWQVAWDRLKRAFLNLELEDRLEVEFYAAYLIHKRSQHQKRIRLPDDD